MSVADEKVLRELRDELYEDYGIYFPENKFYQLKAKIRKRLRELGLDSIRDYRDRLRTNPDEVSSFLDTVSTNTTKFYREPRHWSFYEELLEGQWSNRSSLKLWSAACSSGEEPYTLAMFTHDHRSSEDADRFGSNYRILATDLSTSSLRSGIQGQYREETIEELRLEYPDYARKYFTREDEDTVRVADVLRDRVTFRKFNLKSRDYPYRNTFDLILIRNVLIYFDTEVTTQVIRNLTDCLREGGFLFSGHSESLNSIDHSLEKVQAAIYRKT